MNRWLTSFFGILLVLIALGCLMHTTRMAIANTYYYHAKYGPARDDADKVLQMCRSAAGLCRYHYLFAEYAADKAFATATEGDPEDSDYYIDQARFWCERALALNPRLTLMNWVKARLLWRESPSQAIRYWENYVAWHFWDHFNHAMLASMHAQAGDLLQAEKELMWVKGSTYYANTARIIEEARSRQVVPAADEDEGSAD